MSLVLFNQENKKVLFKSGLLRMGFDISKKRNIFNMVVNGTGPGFFVPKPTKHIVENENFKSNFINQTPSKRWGLPYKLAGAASFLASKACYFVNYQFIYVDGEILAVL